MPHRVEQVRHGQRKQGQRKQGQLHRSFPAVLWLLPSGGESTIHTASTSKITPPAIDNDPIESAANRGTAHVAP